MPGTSHRGCYGYYCNSRIGGWSARAPVHRSWWKAAAPVGGAIVIALLPAPAGLQQHAWWYFAIFAGVIIALMLEPLPGGAVGLIGVTLITVLGNHVFFSPDQLAKAGARWPAEALRWELSGFANTTVWLIFGAFMFALGYEETGLGRRIALLLVKAMGRRTLTLGYAVTVADLILAPLTPSNNARSGGTIFPVIKNLPPLYESKPNDPSARRIGGYLMWTALAATCITSSMFLTGLAPNLLALELAQKTAKVQITWMQWFAAFAPIGILLLAVLPLLVYVLYPPEVKQGVVVFFLTHYLFASVTAHVTALLPVMLTVGSTVPGLPMQLFSMLLLVTLGIMGILTPYATGPSPVYYGSGYVPSGKFWQLGAIFGAIFLAALLVIGVPWIEAIG